MPYNKGRKVVITQGMLKGRNATVRLHRRKGKMVIYELDVEGWPYPFNLRSSYLRVAKRKVEPKKAIKKAEQSKPAKKKSWIKRIF